MAISAELIWRADMHPTDNREAVQRCPITHTMSRSRPTRRRASHGQYSRRHSTAYRLADLAVVGRGQRATRDLEVDLGIRRLSTSCALYFGAEVSKESAYRKSPVLESYSHRRMSKARVSPWRCETTLVKRNTLCACFCCEAFSRLTGVYMLDVMVDAREQCARDYYRFNIRLI